MTTTISGMDRTARARAANKRKKQDRLASELREAGWNCLPPEAAPLEALAQLAADVSARHHHTCTLDEQSSCAACVARDVAYLTRTAAVPA